MSHAYANVTGGSFLLRSPMVDRYRYRARHHRLGWKSKMVLMLLGVGIW